MSTVKRVTVLEPISSQVVYDNTTEAPKLKVAAYARVSTEQDEQQSSYEAQVNYYNQYIRNNPAWEFVGIYADEGITGTNTKKRDGFNRMIADAKAGKIDLILTKSISRFARNTVDALQTIRELSALNAYDHVFTRPGRKSFYFRECTLGKAKKYARRQCVVWIPPFSRLPQRQGWTPGSCAGRGGNCSGYLPYVS